MFQRTFWFILAEKRATMKFFRIILFSAVLLSCLTACVFDDFYLTFNKTRAECEGRPTADSRQNSGGSDASYGEDEVPSLYFCAVRYSRSYEWQRDTAYLSEEYDLVFYKDFVPVMEMASTSGPWMSADADTHHIIDGHIYTENSSQDSTYISRDGKLLLSFSGREYLKGLLPAEEGIYTLSHRRSGSGFTFRLNGELIFSTTDGNIFGGLDDSSYGSTGALYMDSGQPAFCYYVKNGTNRSCYSFTDGMASPVSVPSGTAQDIKLYDGQAYPVTDRPCGIAMEDSRLWIKSYDRLISGTLSESSGYYSGIIFESDASIVRVCPYPSATVYCGDGKYYAVTTDDSGGTGLFLNGELIYSAEESYFLSPACAFLYDGSLVLALSSRKFGGYPWIVYDGEVTEVPVHGFISRVAICTGPAS